MFFLPEQVNEYDKKRWFVPDPKKNVHAKDLIERERNLNHRVLAENGSLAVNQGTSGGE